MKKTALDDLGAFEYHPEGFIITYKDYSDEIWWSDITQINVFKSDLITTDRIDMQIMHNEKVLTISEELPGWHQFVLRTKSIFPVIPKDWATDIVLPPFATNFRTIYDRNP